MDGITDAFSLIKPDNFKISIITAIGSNNEIGKNGKLIWKLSADMKNFRNLTTNQTVVMGRKTYESLGMQHLIKRRNIIVSRTLSGIDIVHSLKQAINLCKTENLFIIGGSKLYKEGLEYADYMYITRIHKYINDADTFFPEVDFSNWEEDYCSDIKIENEIPYQFFKYRRKN